MKKNTSLLTLLLLCFMYSCAPNKSTTAAKISLGAITGSAQFDGGLYVFARNPATGQEIIKLVPPTDEIVIELPTDTDWVFSAVGWNGPANYEGDAYCAKTPGPIRVQGTEFNIPLNASRAGCLASNQPLASDNNFPKLTVSNCFGIKGYLEAGFNIPTGAQCGGGTLIQGQMPYFKISLMQKDEFGTKIPGLESSCITVTGGAGKTDTNINLPDGVGFAEAHYQLTFHSASNCLDPAIETYDFLQGLDNQNKSVGTKGIVLKPTDRTMLLVDETACIGSHLTNIPFAAGNTTDDVYLVCTEAQWDNIAKGAGSCPVEVGVPASSMDCEETATYVIGTDINFGGSNTTNINTFQGELKGSFKTLSNFNKPLFKTIQTSGADHVRLSDFTISGAAVSVDSGATTHPTGILAGKIQDSGGSGKRVEISNISVVNSSVSDTASASTESVGGLIGEVYWSSTPGQDEDLFLRELTVQADVSSTSTASQAIGGLVGKISPTNNNATIAIEIVGVGVVERPKADWKTLGRYDLNDTSKASTIIAGSNIGNRVGGIVGEGQNMEIREGTFAFSTISAGPDLTGGVGGLVGIVNQASSNFDIDNAYGRLVFQPSSNSDNIGGLVGMLNSTSGSKSLSIEGSHGEIIIGSEASPEGSFFVGNLGGLVGYYWFDGGTPNLSIEDSRGKVDTYVGGMYHGGLVGKYKCGGGCTRSMVIERSIVMGKFSDETTGSVSSSSANMYRGGLVGLAEFIETRMNVVEIDIEAKEYIGGAFGKGDESKVKELDFAGNLQAAMTRVGGIAGEMTAGGGSEPYVDSVKLNGNIELTGNDPADCSGGLCGQIFGMTNLSGAGHTVSYLTKMSISDSNNDDLSIARCGADEPNCDTEVTNFVTNDTSCGPLSGTFVFADVDNDTVSACDLTFIAGLAKFAPILNNSNQLVGYRMGSVIDPYEIKSAVDWNKIGADAFLVKKSFKIVNDIDFTAEGQTPNPIGSDANISGDDTFGGTIFGEGVIRNVTLTTASSYGGLINTSEGGELGIRNRPLSFDGLNIVCNSSTACGLIGHSDEGNVFVDIKNAEITESSTAVSVGGLIGLAKGRVEIDSSRFNGAINVPTSTNVGGFVGKTSDSSTELQISESGVILSHIKGHTGAGSVGGIIGDFTQGNSSSRIEKSYIWLDHKNLSAGDDIEGSWKGLLAGKTSQAGVTIDTVYADITSATLPSGVTTVSNDNTSGGRTINNYGVVGLGLVNPATNDATWSHSYQSSTTLADMVSNLPAFNGDKWLYDSNGRLVPKWEVEGHDN